MPSVVPTAFALLLCLIPVAAQSWTNHAPGSALSLAPLAGLSTQQVQVASLEDFLRAERQRLVAHLEAQERFTRKHFPQVPPTPKDLQWAGTDSGSALTPAFLRALRLNPEIRLANFIQAVPGADDVTQLMPLPLAQVVVFSDLDSWGDWQFYRLAVGQSVSALSVVASAADEPDYGHDINLFEDNPGSVGALYQFGLQPIGDSRFEHSSQAPFHMGFYHEHPVIFAAGGFLKNTFADWRAYQFFSLATFAFENGHDYWGYRFMGWGLHYVQDLTQPYHATVLPGVSTAAMLWIYVKDVLGFSQAKTAAITRNANYHTFIESLQYAQLRRQLAQPANTQALVDAYRTLAQDERYPSYGPSYLRRTIAAQARASAAALDALIDPLYSESPAQVALTEDSELARLLVQLTGHFGAHTRNAVRTTWIKPEAASAP